LACLGKSNGALFAKAAVQTFKNLKRNYLPMHRTKMLFGAAFFVLITMGGGATAQTGTAKTPDDGHTIHLVAASVVNVKAMGPFDKFMRTQK
jgi:hypothetical protein